MVIIGTARCSISWIVRIDMFCNALICIKYFTVSEVGRCISCWISCCTYDVFFAIGCCVYLFFGIGFGDCVV